MAQIDFPTRRAEGKACAQELDVHRSLVRSGTHVKMAQIDFPIRRAEGEPSACLIG